MEHCKTCKGSGLKLRTKPFQCPQPHPQGVLVCIHCENVPKGNYVTCEECYGSGVVTPRLKVITDKK